MREFELESSFELWGGVRLSVVASGKKIFDVGLPPLFTLVIGLENEFWPLVGVGFEFLEVLLHRLVFGVEMLDSVVDGMEFLDLRVLGLWGEGVEWFTFVGLSSFFAKLQTLFIFLWVLQTDAFELEADLVDHWLLYVEGVGVTGLDPAQHHNQIGQLGIFNYFGKHVRLDGFHRDCGIFLPFEFADCAQTFADGWVEVVFDGVVGSRWGDGYLPAKCLEISFHLLPCLRCASNKI